MSSSPINPLAETFAALQAWQHGTGTSDEVAELALRLTAGDEDKARDLLHRAAAMWQTVQQSASQPFRTGEDGSSIGAAHGRARKTAAA